MNVKGNFMCNVLRTKLQENLKGAILQIKQHSQQSKLRSDEDKIEELKSLLQQQVDELLQRDNKIKTQETFLNQKERGIIEHEKGLTEKSRRLLELSKSLRLRKKFSPPKIRQPSKTPKAQVNLSTSQNSNIFKTFNQKVKVPQLQSLTQPTTIHLTMDENNEFKLNSLPPVIKSSIDLQRYKVTNKSKLYDFSFQQKRPSIGLQSQSQSLNSMSQLYSNFTGKENSKVPSSLMTLMKKDHENRNAFGIRKYSPRNNQTAMNIPPLSSRSTRGQQNSSNQIQGKASSGNISVRQSQQKLQFSFPTSLKDTVYSDKVEDFMRILTNTTRKIERRLAFQSIQNNTNWIMKQKVAMFMVQWQSRKVLSTYMIKWLRSIYADEIENHETVQIQRERKLLRVLLIAQRVNQRQDIQVESAFKVWKKMEYQIVLEGLRKYSELLDKNHVQNILTTTDDIDFENDDDDDDPIFLCTDEQEEYEPLTSSRTMGAAMEEARRILYEKAIKKFTLQEVTRHHKMPYKNLVEMLTRYPGNGEGFKVTAKWWQPGTFFHIKNVQLFSGRYGRMEGVQYIDNKPAGGKVEHMRGILKRGVWNYELNDPAFTKPEVELDNGLKVNLVQMQEAIDEKKAFLAERKKMIEWIKPPEVKAKDPKAKKGLKGKAAPKKK